MARFRRRSRPRIRWAWTGFSGSVLLGGSGRTIISIVEPQSFPTVADITVERTLIDIGITYDNVEESTPVAADPLLIAVVLTTAPTDTDEDVVTQAIPDPLSGDIDDTQKRVMWTKWFYTPPLPNALNAVATMGTMGAWAFSESLTANNLIRNVDGMFNMGNPFDIGVRRKLGGDQALVLAISPSAIDVDKTLTVHLYARALLRIGRK